MGTEMGPGMGTGMSAGMGAGITAEVGAGTCRHGDAPGGEFPGFAAA
ncbi:hypothetical protein EDF60_2177 [Leucobacter luti]|nr:hypothetical protein EDF60_2177 [Leucobacter luti]